VSRIAVISDVHGHLPALERVLADVEAERCDAIWCLGDTVGYGPEPVACLELLAPRCEVMLKGNHEAGVTGEAPLSYFGGVAGAVEGIQLAQRQIQDHPQQVELWELLRGMALEVQLETSAGPVLAVHASPRSLFEFVNGAGAYWFCFSETPQASLVLGGHTHAPAFCVRTPTGTLDFSGARARREDGLVFTPGRWAYVNPGSVGRPRAKHGKAEWGILTLGAGDAPERFDWMLS
jgi:predicted phosphodiesterase